MKGLAVTPLDIHGNELETPFRAVVLKVESVLQDAAYSDEYLNINKAKSLYDLRMAYHGEDKLKELKFAFSLNDLSNEDMAEKRR